MCKLFTKLQKALALNAFLMPKLSIFPYSIKTEILQSRKYDFEPNTTQPRKKKCVYYFQLPLGN